MDGRRKMEYVATLSKEGRYTLVEFPDCPGCSTFVDPDEGEEVESVAREALEGWLVAHLMDGDAPPPPKMRSSGAQNEVAIRVAPTLAIALQIRWRRQELGWSQAKLGKALGVTRQQAAALEDPSGNLRMSTLEKVAAALNVDLDVELNPA